MPQAGSTYHRRLQVMPVRTQCVSLLRRTVFIDLHLGRVACEQALRQLVHTDRCHIILQVMHSCC